MMMKKIWVIAGAAIILIIALSVAFFSQFRLSSSTPKNGAKNVDLNTAISLTFSQPLASLPTFGSTPAVDGNFSFSQKVATLKLTQPLKPGVTYTVVVGNVKSKNGATLQNVVVKFTTVQQAGNLAALQKKLPYTTDQFSVDYIAENNTYSVNISADPVASAKAAALAFLGQYGITPGNSDITFYLQPGVTGSTSVGP